MRTKDKVKETNNRKKAYDYLVQEKGLQPHIASGLVGNIMQESYKLNQTWAEGQVDDVGSVGILQWHSDRKDNLYNFYKQQNPNYKRGEEIPLTSQLDFVLYEATHGDPWMQRQYEKAFSSATPEEAALNFSKYVLRPNKKYAHNDKRVNYALDVYSKNADNAVYTLNEDGTYDTINPAFATADEKAASEVYKQSFYDTLPLTSFENTQENSTFAQQKAEEKETVEDNREEELAAQQEEWKARLDKKVQHRNRIRDIVQSGYLDFVAPEYERVNAAQAIQQNYMQDGGQIPVSPRGVYSHPNAKQIIVPTDGNITMEGVKYPIKGKSLETGEEIIMQPGKNYFFKNTQNVLEIPLRDGQ